MKMFVRDRGIDFFFLSKICSVTKCQEVFQDEEEYWNTSVTLQQSLRPSS